MSGTSRLNAIVVGAGLAGLACAADLTAAGRPSRSWRAADAVGGRMRTDRVSTGRAAGTDSLLDRGFQVFNTSYPQVARLGLRALRLSPVHPRGAAPHPRGPPAVHRPDPAPRRPGRPGARPPGRPGRRGRARLAQRPGHAAPRGPAARARTGPEHADRAGRRPVPGELVESCSGRSWPGVPRGPTGDLGPLLPPGLAEHAARHPCLPRRGMRRSPPSWPRPPPGTVRLESPVRTLTGQACCWPAATSCAADAVVVATEQPRPPPCCRARRPRHPHGHERVPRGPGQPARRADLLVDTDGEILNTCPLRGRPGLRPRPGADLHLGARGRRPRRGPAVRPARRPVRTDTAAGSASTATPSTGRCPPCPRPAAQPSRPGH